MGMPVTMVMPMVAEAVGMIVVVTIAMGVAVGLAVRLGMGMHFAILLYAPAERDAADVHGADSSGDCRRSGVNDHFAA